ncbi:Hsp20/alpha crystallin family protein [Yinghuangia seranimata]|uniref:Hsp20/alpha crystallin family protein n=1 Tax=Yinghuangia seranimata TaxID=408067 RepID=UPI00248B795E|nr:Hsp20/alpha crystallin family protein [Yinghuangia seranimata]MDI2130496.1 Hsp20/alpha crystallin family protein [Yinghuangia seranimata]
MGNAPARRTFWSGFPELIDWLEVGLPIDVADARGMRIEESVGEGLYTVRAEIPGIDPDKDLELSVSGGVLTIHAVRQSQTTGKHRSEFRYGAYTRGVRLPEGAHEDKATAEYKGGVLTVTVPFDEKKRGSKTIKVKKTD